MKFIIVVSFFFLTLYLQAQQITDIDQRVKNLISQMTVEEKINQLSSGSAPAIPRLSIPVYNWHNECLHGLVSPNATVFPQSIVLASTWDIPLMYKISSAISDEARVKFKKNEIGLNFWSPTMNINRDPRWGRGQETYGEDPYLTSRFAVAFIKGLQGENKKYFKAIASPKHYAVHSGPESLRHYFNAITDERDFWETYMPAFEAAIMEGKAYSIMSAYNAYMGVPISASKVMLTDILRNKWGFNGYVVSDCYAIGDILWGHSYASSNEDAAAKALKAGCDLDCGVFYSENLKGALDLGLITEADIDTSAFRLFKARFLLGLFDPKDSVEYNRIPDSVLDSKEHSDLSRHAAREGMVLLKNEGNILPLNKKKYKNIFLIGPHANVFFEFLGSYTGWPSHYVTILDGLKSKLPAETNIIYTKGCEVVGSLTEVVSSKYFRTDNGFQGLKGEYFNNINLSGKPALTRIDTSINFYWNRNSPGYGISKDSFSVRWTGTLRVDEDGYYTFKTLSDDGIRLIIDNKTIIEIWGDGNHSKLGFDSLFKDIEYPIEIEYYFHQDNSKAVLEMGKENSCEDTLKKFAEIARNSDLVIFAGGLSSYYENENLKMDIPGFYGGDRTTLDLPTTQEKVLKVLKNNNKSVILVIGSGSCLSLNWEKDSIPAILQAWYGGSETGGAVADILFGDYNPSGKLPITFYKSVTDLPDFTDYNMKGRTYRYFDKEVLYPFGYGLSYTTYNYLSLTVPLDTIELCKKDTIPVIFTIQNSGKLYGEEIVQLYTRKIDSKISQPIKQLKGFKRVQLKAGEVKTDTLLLNLKELYYYDTTNHKYEIEPGDYEIQLGASSQDIRHQKVINIKNCMFDVKEIETKDIDNIYPNPSDGIINFKLNTIADEAYNLEISDIFGRKLDSDIIQNTLSNKFKADFNRLNPGVYFIILKNKHQQFCRKFVIVR
ncbi:MAG: glycoside hydrolase family 3 C-terminal domain-containing protein [Bacteroidota bacterium]